MRNPLILVCLFAYGAFAGDTTYSRTRSVPKGESESGSDAAPFLFRILGELISSGVTPERESRPAPPPPVPEKPADMREWPEGGWRWGLGIGWGGVRVADQGGGYKVDFDGEATYELSREIQMRLQGAGFLGKLKPDVDYRRDVYVDGKLIGEQYDTTLEFSQMGYSCFSDLLAFFGKAAYFGAGAGAVRLREATYLERGGDFSAAGRPRSEVRWHWLPAVRMALGLYAGGHGERAFGRLELGYQVSFHNPLYASSFPTDNSQVTHSLTFGFAWL